MDEVVFFFPLIDHVALRDPRTGSVMVKEMTEVFKQYGNKWHLADFFTIVSRSQVNTRSIQSKANALDENIFMRRLPSAVKAWGGSGVACNQWAGEFRGLWQKSWLRQAPMENGRWPFIQWNTSELAISKLVSSAYTMVLPAWFISPRKRGEPEGFFEDQHYLTFVYPACSQYWTFSEWMRGQEL